MTTPSFFIESGASWGRKELSIDKNLKIGIRMTWFITQFVNI